MPQQRRTQGLYPGCLFMILHSNFTFKDSLSRDKLGIKSPLPYRSKKMPPSSDHDLSSRAQATQRVILDAACSCFAERGFSGTSTRAIAERAKVTQPLIHHYFKTKQALFDAVLDDAVQDYERAQADQWSLDELDPRGLTVGLAVMFDWIGSHPRVLRLMAWARLEGKIVPRSSQKALVDRVFKRFAAAQLAGILRPELDVLQTMMMIDLMFKGYWERAMQQSEVYGGSLSPAQVRTQLIKFIIRAVVTSEHQSVFIEQLTRDAGRTT